MDGAAASPALRQLSPSPASMRDSNPRKATSGNLGVVPRGCSSGCCECFLILITFRFSVLTTQTQPGGSEQPWGGLRASRAAPSLCWETPMEETKAEISTLKTSSKQEKLASQNTNYWIFLHLIPGWMVMDLVLPRPLTHPVISKPEPAVHQMSAGLSVCAPFSLTIPM